MKSKKETLISLYFLGAIFIILLFIPRHPAEACSIYRSAVGAWGTDNCLCRPWGLEPWDCPGGSSYDSCSCWNYCMWGRPWEFFGAGDCGSNAPHVCWYLYVDTTKPSCPDYCISTGYDRAHSGVRCWLDSAECQPGGWVCGDCDRWSDCPDSGECCWGKCTGAGNCTQVANNGDCTGRETCCNVLYSDYCTGLKIVDYNGNGSLDNMRVRVRRNETCISCQCQADCSGASCYVDAPDPKCSYACNAQCLEGDTQTRSCGSGACTGTQTRTCGANCRWMAWSDCSTDGNSCDPYGGPGECDAAGNCVGAWVCPKGIIRNCGLHNCGTQECLGTSWEPCDEPWYDTCHPLKPDCTTEYACAPCESCQEAGGAAQCTYECDSCEYCTPNPSSPIAGDCERYCEGNVGSCGCATCETCPTDHYATTSVWWECQDSNSKRCKMVEKEFRDYECKNAGTASESCGYDIDHTAVFPQCFSCPDCYYCQAGNFSAIPAHCGLDEERNCLEFNTETGCSQVASCNWVGRCEGGATCASLGESACNSTMGCTWTELCEGTWNCANVTDESECNQMGEDVGCGPSGEKQCSSLATQADCNRASSCSWSGTCEGGGLCSSAGDELTCDIIGFFGLFCNWSESCTGTWDCADINDQSDCASLSDCSWKSGDSICAWEPEVPASTGAFCFQACEGTEDSCGCGCDVFGNCGPSRCEDCQEDGWVTTTSLYPCCVTVGGATHHCQCQDKEYRNYFCHRPGGDITKEECTYVVEATTTDTFSCAECGPC
ncbi:MAG: hypothetical protein GF370_02405, partial [Candidatus Nealsonbacteria bacterium]|nr:hypothetical protein [Candidatus Nealsonbacteria bacterium]